jgi:hypothetical protein
VFIFYSKDEIYDQMLELQRSYLHSFKNVLSFFIDFRENQTNLIEIDAEWIMKQTKKPTELKYKQLI